MIPDIIHAALRRVVGPERRHMIEPAAELAALGLDAVDRLTLACAIDEALLVEMPDAEVQGWTTVADVAASYARVVAS